MCWIYGFTWSDGSLIEKTNRLIEHSGPDDHGIHVEDGMSLGNLRPAIIDLRELGHQPMRYERDGKEVRITSNGEIYNHKEVRAQLVRLGCRFAFESDMEVILAVYLQWGTDCVDRFNGMWAFAILDGSRKILFLSKDRFGIKPLHFRFDGHDLIFSSEIKALFAQAIAKTTSILGIVVFVRHPLVRDFRHCAQLSSHFLNPTASGGGS